MKRSKSTSRVALYLGAAAVWGSLTACNVDRAINEGNERSDGGGDADLRKSVCKTPACRVSACTGKSPTTLTGIVNIPAGNLPLYNASVYVPNSTLDPIPTGASCNRCDTSLSGNPIAKTTTDAGGHFKLEWVPDGADVPLVIQVGKWRRQVTLSHVAPCTDNFVDADLTRLPRNQTEGNIPRIALTTGGADALECLLRKLGIADSEFTNAGDGGRVNLYNGESGTARYDSGLNGGAGFLPAPPFWDSLSNLKQYDVVLHSCEGTPTVVNKSVAARQALLDYLNLGGRAFASHYHYVWVEQGPPPLPTIATWNHRPFIGSTTADVDLSFERGAALADWLVNVGASMQRGKLPLMYANNNVQAVNTAVAQRWIHIPAQNNVQYLSVNAPIGADEKAQCGRMVFTDIHVASGDTSGSTLTFPSGGCTTTSLLPQEKALIYMLFDLSNCLDPVIG